MSRVIGFYRAGDAYGCFSNFYHSPFIVDGVDYFCSEQYIMHQKALLFGDMEIAGAILDATNPAVIKGLGRQVRKFDDAVWKDRVFDLAMTGLYAKFAQNHQIRKILLDTGGDILAECAPRDRIWGIGLGVNNPDVQHPACWKGKNMLGELLMEVRRKLREDYYAE